MESIYLFIQENAQYAPWVIFGLFMLAGINFPISEDILIVLSGVMASTYGGSLVWKLFIAVFLGAYISDWVAYWIGRICGPNLWKMKWFSKVFRRERLNQIEKYYKKYGVLTLLIGRFIPFGVRNCLFVTAGMGKMPFGKFLLSDGIACLLSNTTLFLLSYFCGKNITHLLKFVNIIIFAAFATAFMVFIWYKKSKTVSSID